MEIRTSATGAIDRSYDVLDRVTQEVSPQGIVSYSYDVLSRRLLMRANALQPVTYSYDANSQLTQVAQGVINGVLTHDALGRRTQLQRSNGVTTTYAYDPASRLAGLTHAKGATVLESLNYGLDQADNKTQVQQAQEQATALPPAVTAAYDAANQQAQFAGANLAYDPNGNLTSDGTTTYVWDARDRLIGISGGTSATFSYDALDRRLAKTISGATTTYLYDGADIVTEAGVINASYLSTLNIDEPLVRQTASGNEYYHTDDLGSTVALSDDAGSVTTRYTYGPFGSTTVTGSSTNSFQFTGRENDGTGLYYYRARYYIPSRSRFLSEDPLEFGGGDTNLYAYVGNNPVKLTDPSGLSSMSGFAGSLPTLPQGFVDFSAGMGDVLTFGLGAQIRSLTPAANVVDPSSSAYNAGGWVGVAGSVATGWVGGSKAVARASSGINWQNFSHSLFPSRDLKKIPNGIAQWLNKTGNRLNGDHIPPQLHTRLDPWARAGVPADWLRANPLFSQARQLLNRIPYVPGSLLYGLASKALNGRK